MIRSSDFQIIVPDFEAAGQILESSRDSAAGREALERVLAEGELTSRAEPASLHHQRETRDVRHQARLQKVHRLPERVLLALAFGGRAQNRQLLAEFVRAREEESRLISRCSSSVTTKSDTKSFSSRKNSSNSTSTHSSSTCSPRFPSTSTRRTSSSPPCWSKAS